VSESDKRSSLLLKNQLTRKKSLKVQKLLIKTTEILSWRNRWRKAPRGCTIKLFTAV